jgi:hypothetical protein
MPKFEITQGENLVATYETADIEVNQDQVTWTIFLDVPPSTSELHLKIQHTISKESLLQLLETE